LAAFCVFLFNFEIISFSECEIPKVSLIFFFIVCGMIIGRHLSTQRVVCLVFYKIELCRTLARETHRGKPIYAKK
jgi:hypothetical protein